MSRRDIRITRYEEYIYDRRESHKEANGLGLLRPR